MNTRFNYQAIKNYVRIGIAIAFLGILGPGLFGFADAIGSAIVIVGFVVLIIGIVRGAA